MKKILITLAASIALFGCMKNKTIEPINKVDNTTNKSIKNYQCKVVTYDSTFHDVLVGYGEDYWTCKSDSIIFIISDTTRESAQKLCSLNNRPNNGLAIAFNTWRSVWSKIIN